MATEGDNVGLGNVDARLRQVYKYGYIKNVHIKKINEKLVWWYYLTPMDSTEEQAA